MLHRQTKNARVLQKLDHIFENGYETTNPSIVNKQANC